MVKPESASHEDREKEVENTRPSTAADSQPTIEEKGTKYPIDLPSTILLSSSMVLAIASTGSLFELFGENSQLPLAVTAGIAVVGLPLGAYLFYAAILKGTAETEEDDKQFLSRN
jgi:hypothetical protein